MNEQSYYIKHTADSNTATQFVFMQPIFKLATRWQTLAGRWYLRRSSSRGPSGETSQMMQIPFCQCCPTTNSGLMLLVKVLYFFQTGFGGIQPFVTSQRAEISADADLAWRWKVFSHPGLARLLQFSSGVGPQRRSWSWRAENLH